MVAANLDRRAEPVVGVLRRHLHVHNRDIGMVGGDLPQQLGRISGARHDFESALGEQPAETLS